MNKTLKIALVTSTVWIVVILATIGIFTTRFDDPGFLLHEFRMSKHARWVDLPDETSGILASFRRNDDANYTTVMFNAPEADLDAIVAESLKENEQYQGEELLKSTGFGFDMESFIHCFGYDSKTVPSWWIMMPPEWPSQSLLVYWEQDSRCMGYIGFYHEDYEEVRIFRFSEQNRDCEMLVGCFPLQ